MFIFCLDIWIFFCILWYWVSLDVGKDIFVGFFLVSCFVLWCLCGGWCGYIIFCGCGLILFWWCGKGVFCEYGYGKKYKFFWLCSIFLMYVLFVWDFLNLLFCNIWGLVVLVWCIECLVFFVCNVVVLVGVFYCL